MMALSFPVSFMKAYSSLVIIFTIMFTLLPVFTNEKIDVKSKDLYFNGFKCLGYSVLAYLIFSHYIEQEMVPVLDFFAFVLAAFEGGHTFVNSFGEIITLIIKMIFKRD